jgi:ribosomal protein L7/L12
MALDPYRKIEAIKLYREETNASLKDPKEAVEDFLISRRCISSLELADFILYQ